MKTLARVTAQLQNADEEGTSLMATSLTAMFSTRVNRSKQSSMVAVGKRNPVTLLERRFVIG